MKAVQQQGSVCLTEDILKYAATNPEDHPLYQRRDQAKTLLDGDGRRVVGLGIKGEYGGAVSFWLAQGKATISGNADQREPFLRDVSGWTTAWAFQGASSNTRNSDSELFQLPSREEFL